MPGETVKSIPQIIGLKKMGGEMTNLDVETWVDQLVSGQIAGEQLGAWLMAVCLKGLTDEEISCLTRCMAESGSTLEWPEDWDLNRIVDKHSTGGVGDKVSLPLAPALAACGLRVPMVSGRGLGMTGGTLDKLESIPNYSVDMSMERMREALETVGCCIVGQSKEICPADKRMYQARDITETVGSRGLVTSSIICKKIAEGLSSLVLDVKWGLGCYQETYQQAIELADGLVTTASSLGVKTTAVISNMNTPLGMAVGNSLEVLESVECLQGAGAADLRELVCIQGGLLLHSAGLVQDSKEGELRIAEVLDNGAALEKFKQMLIFQGVEEGVAEQLVRNGEGLRAADNLTKLESEESGYVTGIQAKNIAQIANSLGAGRNNPDDQLDHSAGVRLTKSLGDWVAKGDVWAVIHHNRPLPDQIMELARKSIEVKAEKGDLEKRITKIINLK